MSDLYQQLNALFPTFRKTRDFFLRDRYSGMIRERFPKSTRDVNADCCVDSGRGDWVRDCVLMYPIQFSNLFNISDS